jgi:succinate-semialdehyde dehydrogenase / glutarate-semialdehyde dehydrogenase
VSKQPTFAVYDPATLQLIDCVPDMSVADAVAAVDRASTALPAWSKTAPRVRSEMLRRTFELMMRESDPLAALISRENGKSLADARAEVAYAAEFFRWFAEEAVRPGGDFGVSPAGGTRTVVQHKPIGVAALVTPWNFPAAMATRKIAPALAAGCTVVLKPAEETPLTALAVARLLSEAGVPDGVVEVVTTRSAPAVVAAWLDDSRVRKLSFTGSTQVGRALLRHAADRVVSTSMELGGNAPVVVAADADLDLAVEGTMIAKFRNGGQACTAANRVFVHETIADEFIAAFCERVAALKVGPATDGADIGPLISERSVARLRGAVEAAVAEGARLVFQSPQPAAAGFFFPPTVLAEVPPASAIMAEELFGPVLPIAIWADEDELLAQVNGTEYGLAAYVFSRDVGWAMRFAERVEAGMVGINRGLVSDPAAPFGGVKQSGLGREGARDGLREFQETQYLCVRWGY